MQTNSLDIQQGRIKHFLYKSKVRSALYGGSVDKDFFSTGGPIGEWIANVGLVKYGHLPEMKRLEHTHKELNYYAQQLVSLYSRGRMQEAKDGLPKFETYSDQIMELFQALDSYK